MNRIKCSWAANDPKAKNTEKNGQRTCQRERIGFSIVRGVGIAGLRTKKDQQETGTLQTPTVTSNIFQQ